MTTDKNNSFGKFAMFAGAAALAIPFLMPKIDDDQILNRAFTNAVNTQMQTSVQKQNASALSSASYASNTATLEFSAAAGTIDLNQARADAKDVLQKSKAMEKSAKTIGECIGIMYLIGGAMVVFGRKKSVPPTAPGPT